MRIKFYDYDTPDLPKGRSIFLAGPTTDAYQTGREFFLNLQLSTWRAMFVRALADQLAMEPKLQDLTVVVPEFKDKGDEQDWFSRQASIVFGPEAGRAVVRWEEKHMAHADIVVAWNDVRRRQPALGLNARPEVYGLMLRSQLRAGCGTWAPKKLLLGVPPEAQAVTRFHVLAEELRIPVHSHLADLVVETIELLKASVPCSV